MYNRCVLLPALRTARSFLTALHLKTQQEEIIEMKIERCVACAVFALAVVLPVSSLAASPFDGTWHTNLEKTKFSPKPVVFYLSQGWYHCVSCSPAYDVQADGQDHPVAGQSYDTISVTVVDPKTLSFAAKKDGKADFEQTRTVSDDGKTLTVKTTGHPLNSDQPVTQEGTAKLVGAAPAGVHATSGNWQILKATSSENGLDTTYKTNGDEVTMTSPTGETYTAKLDGQDYPYKGSHTVDTVSLKKIDAHTFEETDKRGGEVIEVDRISVSGRTMTVVANSPRTGRTSTYTATKK